MDLLVAKKAARLALANAGYDFQASADPVADAASEILALLQMVASCPQGAPWLARLEAGGTDVHAAIMAVLAKVRG